MYCINYVASMAEGKRLPIFKSEDLRGPQHEFCVVHNEPSAGVAAARAVLLEDETRRMAARSSRPRPMY